MRAEGGRGVEREEKEMTGEHEALGSSSWVKDREGK